MTFNTGDDPFDSLLSLEDEFYKDGYNLGVSDGSRVGLIEGRFFGLEKGFEKYASMGRLHGRAVIWTGRLPPVRDTAGSTASTQVIEKSLETLPVQQESGRKIQSKVKQPSRELKVRGLAANMRLEKHIRTLYALTESESLSTANNEESVSEFDDRFTRAEGKARIIESLTGETMTQQNPADSLSGPSGPESRPVHVKRGDDAIEDISSLARH